MEKTLILVKPDGVKRGLGGEIIRRFEQRGLTLAALKLLHISAAQAASHYEEHRDKPFFNQLLQYITSGPVIAMVVSGNNAIKVVRTMMGTTNPADAVPGTIRGDYALTMAENIIHGSDSHESAEREIALYFTAAEIIG